MQTSFQSGPVAESTSSGDLAVVEDEEDMVVDGLDVVDMEGGGDFEVIDDGSGLDEEARLFDRLLEVLQDLLMEPGFAALREEFCRAHCGVFEAGEGENKLEYMDLFTQYTALIDGHLEAALAGAMPGVSASEAVTLLAEAAGQEEGGLLAEVLEDLLAMSDFEAFKELMLGYKAEAEGRHAGLCVQVRPLQVHVEEQEEGDARPDLDFGIITVTSTKQPGGRSTPASVPPQVAPAAQKGGPRAAGGPGWR